MTKKIIFAIAIIIAATVTIITYRNHLDKKPVTTIAVEDNIVEQLQKQDYQSIAILASNDNTQTTQADTLIEQIRKDGSIQILAFEIFNPDASPNRLLELVNANGQPEIVCIDGQLVKTPDLANHLQNILNTPASKN